MCMLSHNLLGQSIAMPEIPNYSSAAGFLLRMLGSVCMTMQVALDVFPN